MATKLGGKSDNFAITTKDYWKLDPSLPEGTGEGINSMYYLVFLHCYCYMLYPLKYTRSDLSPVVSLEKREKREG